MKLYLSLLILGVAVLSSLSALPAQAMDCYVDPVYEYVGSGSISSAVFMRDEACMTGSVVLGTAPTGASIGVVGYTDGWYRITYQGGQAWVGSRFVNPSQASRTGDSSDYWTFMESHPSKAPDAATPKTTTTSSTSGSTLLSRVSGYILLQVQGHGEAWYVDPVTGKRYYMKDGPTAFQMMRSFGLGVTEADYESMADWNTSLKSRLRGRIVLRVQALGEAYYIHPQTLEMHYLANGDEAYRIMRLYSLGITDTDLSGVNEAAIPVK